MTIKCYMGGLWPRGGYVRGRVMTYLPHRQRSGGKTDTWTLTLNECLLLRSLSSTVVGLIQVLHKRWCGASRCNFHYFDLDPWVPQSRSWCLTILWSSHCSPNYILWSGTYAKTSEYLLNFAVPAVSSETKIHKIRFSPRFCPELGRNTNSVSDALYSAGGGGAPVSLSRYLCRKSLIALLIVVCGMWRKSL